MPLCASAAAEPTALSSTVLPPVLGPLISRVRSSGAELEVERHHRSLAGEEQRMAAVTMRAVRRRGHRGHLPAIATA